MDYQKSVLSNGIRVVTVPMPSLESLTIDVWVNVGSRHEPKELSGISHFLEHVIMDGGKKYPTSSKVWTAVDSVGGSMNAGTSKLYTNFYVKLHKDHAKLGFDILSDVLLNTRVSPKDVKKERTIILDEITMGNDDPKSVTWKNFGRLIFNGDPLAREVIGTKKIVSEMKRNDLLLYKDKYYVTENMVISSAGCVPHSEIVKLAEKYFGGVKSDPAKANVHPEISTTAPKNRIHLQTKDTEQTNFVLGFPGINSLEDQKRYAQSILRVILGSGASSRLFLNIREKHALAYSVGATTSVYPGAGYFACYAGTDPKNAAKTLRLMLAEINKISSRKLGRITQSEFLKAKNFIKGHTALALESSNAVSEHIGYDELIRGKIEMPEEYLDKIESVTLDEVYQIAQDIFDMQKMVLSVVGPHKSAKEFRSMV